MDGLQPRNFGMKAGVAFAHCSNTSPKRARKKASSASMMRS